MRILALLVVILGIATLVFGIMFIPQASSAKQEVVDSLSTGVTLDNLDAKYDQVFALVKSTQPNDPLYLTYFAQRTSLGLARANVGIAKMANTVGIVDIILGVGLVFGGCALMMRKSQGA
jgi:ABC-type dipeptide/oligopeptide/nickel transport system permease component